MGMSKQYIGDGVYVEHDGYGLVLTTHNGLNVTNTIYLEPEVYRALVVYVTALPTRRDDDLCDGAG
jgi:hypothetical protein